MKSAVSALFILALVAGILPPGEAAYIGSYVAMGAAAIGLLVLSWRERAGLAHPVSLAILAAILLVLATVPFTYQEQADLMGPVFILPLLSVIGLGLMARPAGFLPDPLAFAALCLVAAAMAAGIGSYELIVLDASRVGLGNNPIHYASLAVMAGGLALVGTVSTRSPWRCLFLLGPVFGVAAALFSGSRGPLIGALAMAGVGLCYLLIWQWRDKLLRYCVLASAALGAVALLYLMEAGDSRAIQLIDTALNIFSFTGGSDDIRAALYASAIHALGQSPVHGLGFSQLMVPAETLFPKIVPRYNLENLHADWANFAVLGGGMGLAALLLLLCAPLLLLLDPVVRADRPTVLGALLLVTGQTMLGVSNTMFGVVPQTMLYAVALGYFFARARRLALGAADPGLSLRT